MKRKFFTLIATVLAVLVLAPYCFSQVYKWVDEKGQIHITDYPDPNLPRKKEKPIEPAPLIEVKNEPAPIKEPVKEPPKLEAKEIQPPKIKVEIQNKPQPPKQLVIPLKNVPQAKPIEPPKEVPPPVTPEKGKSQETIGKIIASIKDVFTKYGMIIAISLSAYILCSLALFLIARKLSVPQVWIALIPIAQIWILVSLVRKAFSRAGGSSEPPKEGDEMPLEGSPFDEMPSEENPFDSIEDKPEDKI